MNKYGRSRREAAIDKMHTYDQLAENSPVLDAKAAFGRKPYETISVTEYIAKKYKIGGEGNVSR